MRCYTRKARQVGGDTIVKLRDMGTQMKGKEGGEKEKFEMRGKGRKGKGKRRRDNRNETHPFPPPTQLKLKIKNSLTASIPHDPDSEPGR